MQVTTSRLGKLTLEKNIKFLENLWISKEVGVFLKDVENLMLELKSGRHLKYPKYHTNIRSALIGRKHVRVFFKIENDAITILLYFEVREDYRKIRNLLQQ